MVRGRQGTRILLAALLLASGKSAPGRESASPSEATVFIRIIGELRAEVEGAWKESIEKREVEIGTGSGFVISPFGHVLTNHHVISGEEFGLEIDGTRVQVKLEVQKIEVVLPAAPSGSTAGAGETSVRRFTASVDAEDPELDLALLSIGAMDLPFIPLGDSDALESAQPVEVLGYPFGRQVEVGIGLAPDIVPQVSVSRGSVAALRSGEEGDPRYIQTDATVNPGNSGGPMLDREGYAIGVVRMKLARGQNVGFAVPINRVKDFLESRGLDQLLSARRLRLGPFHSLEGKGLRLRFPEGLEDISPARLRVESGGSADELVTVIDRVASPLNLAELEQVLLSGNVFERFLSLENPSSRPGRLGSFPARFGRAAGVGADGEAALQVEYALVDLGKEKLVARYLGPSAAVAFNRSVLRASLESIEADRLLTAELRRAVPLAFEEASLPAPAAPAIALPAGWVSEPVAPSICTGLPAPDSALSASPEGDYTVSFRVGWWRSPDFRAEQAAVACSASPGSTGRASYGLRAERLGILYLIEGAFLPLGEGVLQLEVEAPAGKLDFVRDLFLAWLKSASGR